MTTQDDKDLNELRTGLNKFEIALQRWVEHETKEAYDEAIKIFIRMSDDYEYIREEYEGEEPAKVAKTMVVTYFRNMLTNLPDLAADALNRIWGDTMHIHSISSLTLPYATALRTLPPEKYELQKKYDWLILLKMKDPTKT